MSEVLEGHIRFHLLEPRQQRKSPEHNAVEDGSALPSRI
jgi:hypothetical protein